MGPCRVLAEGGFLGGLLAPRFQISIILLLTVAHFFHCRMSRFLLIFAACLFSLIGKGLALASPYAAQLNTYGAEAAYHIPDEHQVPLMATIMATMFLPGFFLGVFSCWHTDMLKTIVAHPSVVLMPTFTHFTFTSSTMWCRGRTEEDTEERGKNEITTDMSEEAFITFSPKLTLVNVILSIASSVVYGISLTQMKHQQHNVIPEYLRYYVFYSNFPFIQIPFFGFILTLFALFYISNSSRINSAVKYTLANLVFIGAAHLVFSIAVLFIRGNGVEFWDNYDVYTQFLSVPILGLFVTFLKVILDRYCYYTFPTLTCFSLPRVEYGALVCSDPQAHYVLDADGNPAYVVDDEDEVENQNKEVEVVNPEEAELAISQQDEMVEKVPDQAKEECHKIEIQDLRPQQQES